jgi:hypothetical protein
VGGLQIPTHLIATLEADELPEDFIASEHEQLVNSEMFLKMQRTRKKAEVNLGGRSADSSQFIRQAVAHIKPELINSPSSRDNNGSQRGNLVSLLFEIISARLIGLGLLRVLLMDLDIHLVPKLLLLVDLPSHLLAVLLDHLKSVVAVNDRLFGVAFGIVAGSDVDYELIGVDDFARNVERAGERDEDLAVIRLLLAHVLDEDLGVFELLVEKLEAVVGIEDGRDVVLEALAHVHEFLEVEVLEVNFLLSR